MVIWVVVRIRKVGKKSEKSEKLLKREKLRIGKNKKDLTLNDLVSNFTT